MTVQQTGPDPVRWQEPKPRAVQASRTHALEDLRKKMHQFVIQELGPILYDQRISEADLRKQVEEQLHRALSQERLAIGAADRQTLVQSVFDDVLGYGPIDPLLRDPGINEVMVNGPDRVFIEKEGKIVLTDAKFVDEGHLRRIIDKIVSQVGRRVDEATPMVDARLPDGSRVNVVVSPLAIGGPFMTIRRFATDPYKAEDLVTMGTLNAQVAQFMDACVRGRLNVVVSGGTGTGKTTLLNVLSAFIPSDERIITVEDSKELQLQQPHVLALEGRPPNIESKGEVRIRDLVRNCLRMRPDRIVVGEVRGSEALDMLQAMNTGHDRALELTARHAVARRDHVADGGHGPSRACHPGADGVGARPHHPPEPFAGRYATRHACDRGDGDGRRSDRAAGPVPVRLRHGHGRRGQVSRSHEEHRNSPELQ
jgi:pilus assembly protein CpaF